MENALLQTKDAPMSGEGALLQMKDAATVRVGDGGIDISGFPRYASGFYPIRLEALGDYSVGDGYV